MDVKNFFKKDFVRNVWGEEKNDLEAQLIVVEVVG